MSIKTSQAILKCLTDLKYSVWFALGSEEEIMFCGSSIFSVNFTKSKNSAVLNYHKSWSWSKSLRVSSLLELICEIQFNIVLSTLWWNKLSSRRELTRRDFSRQFSAVAAWKFKMLWRQTSPVTPCFGQRIVTNIQRLRTNKNMI